jgi:hypothetical protein
MLFFLMLREIDSKESESPEPERECGDRVVPMPLVGNEETQEPTYVAEDAAESRYEGL